MEALARLTAAPRARLVLGLVLAALLAASAGCGTNSSSQEVVLRATIEALRDQVQQLQPTPRPGAAGRTPVPSGSNPNATPAAGSPGDWWVATQRASSLWSDSSGGTIVTTVPQSSYLLVLEPPVGSRMHLFLPGGQKLSYVGAGWVEAADVGTVPRPGAREVDLTTIPTERPQPAGTSTPRAAVTPAPDSIFWDWQVVDKQTQVGDLELDVKGLLLGQDTYGALYGPKISASPGTKIVLADLAVKRGFRPGATPLEIHVDFFVIADAGGLEYRGLPLPDSNALPDRLLLSSGQAYRGVVAFILPRDLKAGRLYLTNFLGGKEPPDRLIISVDNIP